MTVLETESLILLYLLEHAPTSERAGAETCQAALCSNLKASRSNVSIKLKRLKVDGLVDSHLGRIPGSPRRQQIYFLTEYGRDQAAHDRETAATLSVVVKDLDGNEATLPLWDVNEFLGIKLPLYQLATLVGGEQQVAEGQRLLSEQRGRLRTARGYRRTMERGGSPGQRVTVSRFPPPFPVGFVNREQEQEAILNALRGEVGVVVLQGIAGVGKTSLMREVFHRLDIGQEAHLLWYSIHSWDTPQSLLEALLELLDGVGLQQVAQRELRGTQALNLGPLLAHLASAAPIVIVLDDLHSADTALQDAMQPLFEFSRREGGVQLLVGSRELPRYYDRRAVEVDRSVVEVRLRGLDGRHTKPLIDGFHPENNLGTVELEEMQEVTGGHPLGLKLLAVSGPADRRNLELFIEEELLHPLDRGERQILQTLGFHVYPPKAEGVLLDRSTDLDGLMGLERKALVERAPDGRLQLPEMISDLLVRHTNAGEQRRVHRLIADFLDPAGGADTGLTRDETMAALIHHNTRGGRLNAATRLLENHGERMVRHGFTEIHRPLEQLLERKLKGRSKQLVPILLAEIWLSWDRDQETRKLLETALSDSGPSEEDRARLHTLLAEVARRQGRSSAMDDHLDQALRSSEDLASPRQADAFLAIGLQLVAAGDLDRARLYNLKALAIYEAIDDVDGEVSVTNNLGQIWRKRGDMTQAEEMFERALLRAEEMDYGLGIARSLHNLGRARFVRGSLEEARHLLVRARDIFDAEPEPRVQCQLLQDLARVLTDLGHPSEARASLEDARRLAMRYQLHDQLDRLAQS